LKKAISIFLIGCFITLGCKNEKTKKSDKITVDSLVTYMSFARDNNLSTKNRLKFNQKALSILENQRNTKQYRDDLFKVAEQFYVLKEDKKLKQALSNLVSKSIEKKDSSNIAKAYNIYGNEYINLQLNDSAYFYLLKSEKLFAKLKDSLSLGKNYIDKAFVQLYESDYSGCELSSIQALSYYKNFNEKQREYDAYNLIGISSNELKNYDNALAYHRKALDYVNRYAQISQSPVHFRSSTLNNIGYVYQNLNNHGEAVKNFKLALSEQNLLKDNPYVYSAIVDNLAYSNFKLKDYSKLPALYLESLKIRNENELFSGVVAVKIHLSEFYATTLDTVIAQNYAHEALQLAKSTKTSGDLLAALKQLSLVEHKNSSLYSKEYIKISDSIQSEERKAKDKFARIAFETDEIILEKDKLAEQNRSLLYFFVASLFVGLLLFVIRTQRAKNRELLLKQQQQKANEDIYNLMISQQTTIEENRVKEKKRIAQELHDGVLGRLFGARLNLDSLNKFTDEESIANRFNYLSELKNIEQDIREISHDLNREKYVLINNFIAIVSNLLEEQNNSFEPEVTSIIDEKIAWENIPNATKINLYRILQESLQNINKYAQAKNIAVELKSEGDSIVLKVTDDGNGFEVGTKKKGIGLQNMLSRANECEGVFDIKSKKGKGTTIMITVPLTANATA
jgi:signal transduction histidine kinase